MLIDTAPNTPNEQRVVWRKYIEERQAQIYRATLSVSPVLTPDGTVSSGLKSG